MKKQFRVYVATPIRGAAGNDATFEQMQVNCDIARKGLTWLQINFPWVDFFCPAVNDKIVQRLVLKGYCTFDQVLECDHEEQLQCKAVVAFRWAPSSGVAEEVELANKNSQPVIEIYSPKELGEVTEEKLFKLFSNFR